jgi:hypothetical protein
VQKLKNIAEFPQVRKVFKDQVPEVIQCHQEGETVLGRKVPIAKLQAFLQAKL